jgi:hypothetical protein
LEPSESLQKVLDKAFRDPISDLLLKYSSLTRTQFETLVIDLLTDTISDKRLTYSEKTLFRTREVSRASFSRTLSQARKNVISSIYTFILLSYIGVFDARPFEEYQILAEKLREYLGMLENSDTNQSKALLKTIETELMEGIRSLAEPTSVKTV